MRYQGGEPRPTAKKQEEALHRAARNYKAVKPLCWENQGPLEPGVVNCTVKDLAGLQIVKCCTQRHQGCPPVALFFGDLRLRERAPGEAVPLSLIESGAEEALPVASLSRIMLS